MSLKKTLIKNKFTYKIYLYYNLFTRHKGFIKRKQYSQWGEDVYINEYFKKLEKGIYLDIGCFHPFMYSNTCLLFNKGWTGINVDINQEANRLKNAMEEKGNVNIFLSEGSCQEEILSDMKSNNQEIEKDAFCHVRLDKINHGEWFAKQFSSKIGAEKTLVQKDDFQKFKFWDSLIHLQILSLLEDQVGTKVNKINNLASLTSLKKILNKIKKIK